MKTIERVKTARILDRIQKGDFDENDVDNLFMRLRAFSKGHRHFREIADFVAHNDVRNQGLTTDRHCGMWHSIRFFREYTGAKRPLNIGSPFPLYIKYLLILQLDKLDDRTVKGEFGLSRKQLRQELTKAFDETHDTQMVSLSTSAIHPKLLDVVKRLLGFLSPSPYSQASVMKELCSVLNANNLMSDKSAIMKQSDKIAVCILLLLHETTIEYGPNKTARCTVSCDRQYIFHNRQFVDANGNPVDYEEDYGTLSVNGEITDDESGQALRVQFPVFTTNLRVVDWCDDELFSIEPLSAEVSDYLVRRVSFDSSIVRTEQFKLGLPT